MTTGGQNVAAALGLSLALANALNGPQRPALRALATGPTSTGTGGGGGSRQPWYSGPLGPFGHYPAAPLVPDIPGVPQGPLTGIPFSPISAHTAAGGAISPWRAMAEIFAELAFVAGAVLLAEDYPAPVIAFLAILWLLFLIANPHPWRSQSSASRGALTVQGVKSA